MQGERKVCCLLIITLGRSGTRHPTLQLRWPSMWAAPSLLPPVDMAHLLGQCVAVLYVFGLSTVVMLKLALNMPFIFAYNCNKNLSNLCNYGM